MQYIYYINRMLLAMFLTQCCSVKEFAEFEVKKDIEDIEPFLERVGEGGTGRVDPFGFLN